MLPDGEDIALDKRLHFQQAECHKAVQELADGGPLPLPLAGKVRNGEYTLPWQQVYLLSCTFGSIGAVGRTGKEVAVGFNPAVAFLGLGLQVFEQGAVHRRMLLCRKGMSCSYAVH